MKTWRKLLGNERGVALPLAMILLMVLTMLTITFMTLGSVEPQISRNLADGARARQLAESGIEWAFNQLTAGSFDSLIVTSSTTPAACGSGISCVVLGAGQTLPGLTASAGTFTVTLRNDLSSIAGDQALIGQGNTVDPTATSDANYIVILKSTGTFSGASRTVTAVIQRGNLLFNGAVSLPGEQADTYTVSPPCSGCYSIDGRDWKDSDSISPSGIAATKYGIATATNSTEGDAEDDFNTLSRRAYVQGKDDGDNHGSSTDGSCNPECGRDTIANDSTLSMTGIQAFLTNLAANPSTQILMSTQACAFPSSGGSHNKPEGIQMTSTGTPNVVNVQNNCTGADQIDQTVNLGTAAAPTLLYFKGEYDSASLFRGLTIDGSDPITGYGVLVIEDSDLVMFQTGQFRWNGIVLVTGRNVSSAFLDSSNTEIRGALIANETNNSEPCCFREFFIDTDGSVKIRASKENIDRALMALYNMRISAFREN
ncbi:MAG: pilus assembly PilX family protein [Acidimicrobiia bacterium]